MSNSNANLPTAQKQRFSVAISTEGYKNLINNYLINVRPIHPYSSN